MERFATNRNGNIDSGTEVLANNIVFMQQAKEDAISNLFGDLFVEGILNTGNEDTMFKLTTNTDGTFNVSQGIAYKQNVAVEPMIYERIAIIDDTETYDSTKPQQTTDDGTGNLVITPKSTGCKNIPITNADTIYYVDLRYLSVCDNKNSNGDLINFSIAKNFDPSSTIQEKRFYKWIDGYQIVLVQSLQSVQGICLGTVSKNTSNQVTIDYTSKTGSILVESSVFMDYFTSGSGITITEEEGKKQLAVNVDDKTIEIADNKVQISNDGLYPYTKFAVNSGFIDSNNNPNILVTDGTDIDLSFGIGNQVPIIVNPAYNRQYTILPTDDYDFIDDAGTFIQSYYGEIANGEYSIFINNTDKDNNNVKLEQPKLEIMKKVYILETAPTALKGNIWLDTSIEPFKAKWYNGFDWIEYHGVPLGKANITGNTVNSVSSYEFHIPIKNKIKLNKLILYRYISDTARENIDVDLSPSGYLRSNSNGISFLTPNRQYDIGHLAVSGTGVADSVWNVECNSFQVNSQPVPRLPDYSTRTQVASSDDNTTASWTATADGWVEADLGTPSLYTPSSDDSIFSINNNAIYSHSSNSLPASVSGGKGIVVIGIYPIKKGDVIRVRRGIKAFFYSNR